MDRRQAVDFRPLVDYLAAQSVDTTTLTLTLAEVAAIVGKPLPRAASTARWWTNRWTRAGHHWSWETAGWHVGAVQLRAVPPAVTFVRAERSA